MVSCVTVMDIVLFIILLIIFGFIGGAFVDASSGLYDTSAIIAESQTRGDGLNLIKNPEVLNYTQNNTVDYIAMDSFAKSVAGLLGGSTKKLPKKEK